MTPLCISETPEDYIASRLSFIETCQRLCILLEQKAVDNPAIANEIGLVIRENKDIIKLYERDLRALLD